jgi:hypothetical protein
MKKLKLLLILSFLAVIAFQSCKTKQKMTKISQSDSTKINVAVKDTIFNVFSDTVCYIFSEDDISKILQQVPYEIFLQNDRPLYLADIYPEIEMQYGKEVANKFVSVAKNYGEKTTMDRVIESNTQYYLKAYDNEGYVFPSIANKDPNSVVKLEKINNIPPEIRTLFVNYPIFNKVNVMGYYSKQKQLSTIYKGELVPLSKLINIAINENGEKLQLNFEEKAEIFLTLIKGFDTKFSIKQITEKPFYNDKIRNTWNYEIIVVVEGKEEKYGLTYYNSRIEGAEIITKDNAYSISCPY